MDVSTMPRMVPLPIKTKGLSFFKSLVVWIASTRQWRIVEEWSYTLPYGGPRIVVPKGFEFDGASIPKVPRLN